VPAFVARARCRPLWPMVATIAFAATLPAPGLAARLDTKVVPTFQSVSLKLDAETEDYTGSTRIELRVREATPSIRFHAEEMPIQRIALTGAKGPIAVQHEIMDGAQVEVRAAQALAPGDYTLDIDFANGFGTQATGLYRMQQDGRGYLFTQFEADDAREAFPCWDEPGFKLEWQMVIEVPEKHTAVTNTPVESESVSDGWRKLVFKRTKPLPSYLLAIAAGTLERVPITGMSIPGNVVTIHGQGHLAQLAVETTPPILKALENYFGEPYPFEKLDLIAIPEYWPGAMENPGAVTYAARILLVDSQAASVSQQRTLARVTAHELSHMWFGDVVTMQWWDDLWLNESFADWLGDKIAHQVSPQFNIEVTELQASLQVMNVDARPSAQAIRQPVESTDNLMQNIGTQYNKGKAVLGMFEQWIGPEKFRTGVLQYLAAHRWGNATAADLWQALSVASGNNLSAALASFIEQPGLPLIRIEAEGGNRIRIRQQRFSNWGVEQGAQTWKVPVQLRYSDGNAVQAKTVLLDQESQSISLDIGGAPAWVLPNADQRGYYCWEVPQDMLRALATNAATILNERERVGFIGNLSALLDAGALNGGDYLFALGKFADDPQPQVISSVLSALGKVELAFVQPENEIAFAAYVRATLGPALERFGAEPRSGEDEQIRLFRPQLLEWLGDTGKDVAILEMAENLARRYVQDPHSIDAQLSGVALQLSAIRGDRALFDDYRQRFESAQVPADRNRYLGALANFRDPEIIEEALRYTLTGPLRSNELLTIPGGLVGYPPQRDRVFRWLTENYDAIGKRLPPEFMGFMPFMAGGCSAERLAKAQEFFGQPQHQAPGTTVQLAKVGDQVHDCVGLHEREGAAVAAFLDRSVGTR